MKALVLIGILACASVASAQQANPYQSPAPGWVLVQPCGQDPGWVPPSHPLASSPNAWCQPQAPAPTPELPWTIAPTLPFELGKAYRDPYGLVMHIIGATVAHRLNPTSNRVEATVVSIDALLYQSEALYRAQQRARPVLVDITRQRNGWWELPELTR